MAVNSSIGKSYVGLNKLSITHRRLKAIEMEERGYDALRRLYEIVHSNRIIWFRSLDPADSLLVNHGVFQIVEGSKPLECLLVDPDCIKACLMRNELRYITVVRPMEVGRVRACTM
jgi:hypothetical protein